MTSIVENAALILREQEAVIGQADEGELSRLSDAIGRANRVFVLGEGRSGLVMRMLAVRLMHLGMPTFVVGETTTPAIEPGDLLVTCSGSGETAVTGLLAEKAASAGATVATFTADPGSRLAKSASIVVTVPTQHKLGAGTVATAQYGASLFEQCTLVFCEAIVLALTPAKPDELIARHANLE
jgi:6-phospho-3-hexuloisomerase